MDCHIQCIENVRKIYSIYYYEFSGTIDYGRFGINPYSVINYFFYQGYRVSVTYDINRYDTVVRRNRANILLYLYTWGAHFIAFNWQGSEFVGYNVVKSDTESHRLGKSIRSFIRENQSGRLYEVKVIGVNIC